ncbi:hypothetical protein AGMMS49543_26600 [Betaproteobacteria bacterium]|nr:hypothetical protein AGMMS49543_26600 [Betaproteobacteria bacterium]
MYEPIRDSGRDTTSSLVSVPSATGGWNTRDAIANMPPTDAVVMDNWMPRESCVALREGYRKIDMPVDAALDPKEIGTIMPYTVQRVEGDPPVKDDITCVILAGNNKLWKWHPQEAAANLSDITPTAAEATIKTNKWNYVIYKKNLIMTRGGSTPLLFEENAAGTTPRATKMQINTDAATVEGTVHDYDVDMVAIYRGRMYISAIGCLGFFYTEAGKLPGATALSYNDLSYTFTHGGSVELIANWSKTGAEGLDNYLIVVTTMGEVGVFSGDDPVSTAPNATWKMEGLFHIPKVIHGSNAVRVGGDLILITEEGYIGLGDMLNANFINTDNALSDKINVAVKDLLRNTEFPHWNQTFYLHENLLIVNVPANSVKPVTETHQHVLNLSTGAWCRFTGLNATCFGEFNSKLYFAKTGGGLYEMFSGSSDDGEAIKGYVQQAYSNFGSPKIKMFKNADILSSHNLSLQISLNFFVDFKRGFPNAKASMISVAPLWNISHWDAVGWDVAATARLVPIAIEADAGIFGSIGIAVETNMKNIEWYATILTMSIAK